MKIGMAGAGMMLTPWMDGIRFASELGYQAFEIFGEFPQTEIDLVSKEKRKRARSLAEEFGLEIVVHAPFNNLNIASLNRGILKESVRQIISAVKFSRDLGGNVAVSYTHLTLPTNREV